MFSEASTYYNLENNCKESRIEVVGLPCHCRCHERSCWLDLELKTGTVNKLHSMCEKKRGIENDFLLVLTNKMDSANCLCENDWGSTIYLTEINSTDYIVQFTHKDVVYPLESRM